MSQKYKAAVMLALAAALGLDSDKRPLATNELPPPDTSEDDKEALERLKKAYPQKFKRHA